MIKSKTNQKPITMSNKTLEQLKEELEIHKMNLHSEMIKNDDVLRDSLAKKIEELETQIENYSEPIDDVQEEPTFTPVVSKGSKSKTEEKKEETPKSNEPKKSKEMPKKESPAKPATKAPAKPATKAPAKPAAKAPAKPAAKAPAKPVAKAPAKPAAKAPAKPAAKAPAKPVAKIKSDLEVGDRVKWIHRATGNTLKGKITGIRLYKGDATKVIANIKGDDGLTYNAYVSKLTKL